MNKPINPKQHGLIDYGFGALNFTLPALLGINKIAKLTYGGFAIPFLITNLLTRSGAGVGSALSMKTHKTIDAVALGGLALLTFTPGIRKEKKALMFHLGFVALAAANYFLTDYRERYTQQLSDYEV